MAIISGKHSIVIINPAITPLAASSFRDWEKFGTLSNKISVPPFFQADIGAQITIKIFESKAEIIFKSVELNSEFQKIQRIAESLYSAFNAFETKAVGVNFNALWFESDFDFEAWRRKIFKFEFKNNPIRNMEHIISTEFKISVKNEGFIRNITFSEVNKDEEKGLQVNVNNHFDLNLDNKFQRYENVIQESAKILNDTICEIQEKWLAE